ncbi:unnamed protein product [Owenia fusiformis]|uniref:Uncharacterized protein n=1 Tax=Owenia fusiformis TaxID=6347 RepID=A0A8J1TWW1_OWEFU|nr:unnamed protein product [Owenia fusiformis]
MSSTIEEEVEKQQRTTDLKGWHCPVETNNEEEPSTPYEGVKLQIEDVRSLSEGVKNDIHSIEEDATNSELEEKTPRISVNTMSYADIVESDPKRVCGITRALNTAVHQTDKEVEQFWCNFCKFKCIDSTLFNQHVATHVFMCKFCNYAGFTRLEILQHNLFQHNNKDATQHKFCSAEINGLEEEREIVGKNVARVGSYGERKDIAKKSVLTSIEDMSMKCKWCTFSTIGCESLYSHVTTWHGCSSNATEECRFCSFKNHDINVLNIHIMIFHTELIKDAKFSCVECNTASEMTMKEMESHIHHKSFTARKSLMYGCFLCKFNSYRNEQLPYRVLAHVMKQHGCKRIKFMQNSIIKSKYDDLIDKLKNCDDHNYTEVMQSPSSTPPMSCHICSEKFFTEVEYDNHLQQKHNLPVITVKHVDTTKKKEEKASVPDTYPQLNQILEEANGLNTSLAQELQSVATDEVVSLGRNLKANTKDETNDSDVKSVQTNSSDVPLRTDLKTINSDQATVSDPAHIGDLETAAQAKGSEKSLSTSNKYGNTNQANELSPNALLDLNVLASNQTAPITDTQSKSEHLSPTDIKSKTAIEPGLSDPRQSYVTWKCRYCFKLFHDHICTANHVRLHHPGKVISAIKVTKYKSSNKKDPINGNSKTPTKQQSTNVIQTVNTNSPLIVLNTAAVPVYSGNKQEINLPILSTTSLDSDAKSTITNLDECSICAVKVKAENMDQHLLIHSTKSLYDVAFQCGLCDVAALHIKKVEQHFYKTHGENLKFASNVAFLYRCKKCSLIKHQETGILLHIQSMHPSLWTQYCNNIAEDPNVKTAVSLSTVTKVDHDDVKGEIPHVQKEEASKPQYVLTPRGLKRLDKINDPKEAEYDKQDNAEALIPIQPSLIVSPDDELENSSDSGSKTEDESPSSEYIPSSDDEDYTPKPRKKKYRKTETKFLNKRKIDTPGNNELRKRVRKDIHIHVSLCGKAKDVLGSYKSLGMRQLKNSCLFVCAHCGFETRALTVSRHKTKMLDHLKDCCKNKTMGVAVDIRNHIGKQACKVFFCLNCKNMFSRFILYEKHVQKCQDQTKVSICATARNAMDSYRSMGKTTGTGNCILVCTHCGVEACALDMRLTELLMFNHLQECSELDSTFGVAVDIKKYIDRQRCKVFFCLKNFCQRAFSAYSLFERHRQICEQRVLSRTPSFTPSFTNSEIDTTNNDDNEVVHPPKCIKQELDDDAPPDISKSFYPVSNNNGKDFSDRVIDNDATGNGMPSLLKRSIEHEQEDIQIEPAEFSESNLALEKDWVPPNLEYNIPLSTTSQSGKGNSKRRKKMSYKGKQFKASSAMQHEAFGYQCLKCRNDVTSIPDMKQHIIWNHPHSDTPWTCRDNHLRFQKKSSKLYLCHRDNCSLSTPDLSEINQHIEEHDCSDESLMAQQIGSNTDPPDFERAEDLLKTQNIKSEPLDIEYEVNLEPQDKYQDSDFNLDDTIKQECIDSVHDSNVEYTHDDLELTVGDACDSQSVTQKDDKMYYCSYCQFRTSTLSHIRSHVADEHDSMEGGYTEMSSRVNADGDVVVNVTGSNDSSKDGDESDAGVSKPSSPMNHIFKDSNDTNLENSDLANSDNNIQPDDAPRFFGDINNPESDNDGDLIESDHINAVSSTSKVSDSNEDSQNDTFYNKKPLIVNHISRSNWKNGTIDNTDAEEV